VTSIVKGDSKEKFIACSLVTKEMNLDTIQQFVFPQIENLQPTIIFQQDGALLHWDRIMHDYLDAAFQNHCLVRDAPFIVLPGPRILHLKTSFCGVKSTIRFMLPW
jgi:hypothetical protein